MKKTFNLFTICLVIALVVFNVIAFVSVAQLPDGFTASFWIGYVFITLAFFGQLACAYFAFKAENLQKMFYNLPLVTVSYTGLIVTFIFGVLCMAIPSFPYWISIIICLLALTLPILSVLKATATADIVADVDSKIKTKTFFIKSLTVDAETLLTQANTDEAKAACQKVFEAVRYSDPMSNDALAGVESQITLKFNELSEAVSGETYGIGNLANELVTLIGDRNKKCKLLK